MKNIFRASSILYRLRLKNFFISRLKSRFFFKKNKKKQSVVQKAVENKETEERNVRDRVRSEGIA